MSRAGQTMDHDALAIISQRTGSIKFALSSEEAAEGHQSEAQLRHSAPHSMIRCQLLGLRHCTLHWPPHITSH